MVTTFINQKLDGFFNSNEHRIALKWSALVVRSFLIQESENRLHSKGHIIHVNLGLQLGLDPIIHGLEDDDEDHDSDRWVLIESLLAGGGKMGAPADPDLVLQWRRDWQGSMKRQQRWEKQGV